MNLNSMTQEGKKYSICWWWRWNSGIIGKFIAELFFVSIIICLWFIAFFHFFQQVRTSLKVEMENQKRMGTEKIVFVISFVFFSNIKENKISWLIVI